MKLGVIIFGAVALAILLACANCQLQITNDDVINQMPSILKAMALKGPTTDNENLNKFITEVTQVIEMKKMSPPVQLTSAQVNGIISRGLAALGAATNTSKANMETMSTTMAKMSSKASSGLDVNSLIRLAGEMYPYLGDGTAASKTAIAKMFFNFLPKTAVESTKGTASIDMTKFNLAGVKNVVKPLKPPVNSGVAPIKVAAPPAPWRSNIG